MAVRRTPRNSRRWYERNTTAVLEKSKGVSVLVEIGALLGDCRDTDEMLYQVVECQTRQCYTVSDKDLRKATPKDWEDFKTSR